MPQLMTVSVIISYLVDIQYDQATPSEWILFAIIFCRSVNQACGLFIAQLKRRTLAVFIIFLNLEFMEFIPDWQCRAPLLLCLVLVLSTSQVFLKHILPNENCRCMLVTYFNTFLSPLVLMFPVRVVTHVHMKKN